MEYYFLYQKGTDVCEDSIQILLSRAKRSDLLFMTIHFQWYTHATSFVYMGNFLELSGGSEGWREGGEKWTPPRRQVISGNQVCRMVVGSAKGACLSFMTIPTTVFFYDQY